MFNVLLERQDNTVLSKMDIYLARYPKSSIKRLSRYTSYDELKALRNKPLLSIGWLVILNGDSMKNIPIKFLKSLDEENLILLHVTSKRKCQEFLEVLKTEKIKFNFINNYKLDDKIVFDYIRTNLDISLQDAKFLHKRNHGYLRDIVNSVQTLKSCGKITRSLIIKYTPDHKNIAVFDLVNYILGISSNVSYEDAVQLVYDYRYGFDHLLKSTLAQINLYSRVFNLVMNGELTLLNYKSEKSNIKDKEISQLHDFRLYKIIESFNVLSFDYLYLVHTKISQISPNFYLGVFDFINILKWNSSMRKSSNSLEKALTERATRVYKEALKKVEDKKSKHYDDLIDNYNEPL